jgi:Flp pilus assembly protein TadG
MSKILIKVRHDKRGTTAVEFAIVAPVFILLVIGIMYLCMGLSVAASMHYAVEDAARCASVSEAVYQLSGQSAVTRCTQATTVSYTQNHYYGPSSMPNFTSNSQASCGNAVTGTINYVVNLGLSRITVPISASACFPAPPPPPPASP